MNDKLSRIPVIYKVLDVSFLKRVLNFNLHFSMGIICFLSVYGYYFIEKPKQKALNGEDYENMMFYAYQTLSSQEFLRCYGPKLLEYCENTVKSIKDKV